MKNILSSKTAKIILGALIAVTIFIVIKPNEAKAFDLIRLIDPLCITCDDDSSSNSNNTIINSYNTVNSYNNDSYISATTRGTVRRTDPVIRDPYIIPPTVVTPPVVTPPIIINPPYVIPPTVINNEIVINNPQPTHSHSSYRYNNYPSYNYYNQPSYQSLSVSCYPSRTNANIGDSIVWNASISGGYGGYNITWSGNDNLYGYNSSVYKTYNYPGIKYASVTVTSNGQTVTQNCYNNVQIFDNYYTNTNTYTYPNYNNYNTYSNTVNGYPSLQIACYPDKVNTKTGNSVNWGVEVIGGTGNYTYLWTGTDGLTGNQSSVSMTYNQTGQKSATVTIYSNGQSTTQACGKTVTVTNTVTSSVTAKNTTKSTGNQISANNQSDNSMSAASLFSLKNVPWGWVAVLVILTLIFTVIYLLINRNKI